MLRPVGFHVLLIIFYYFITIVILSTKDEDEIEHQYSKQNTKIAIEGLNFFSQLVVTLARKKRT